MDILAKIEAIAEKSATSTLEFGYVEIANLKFYPEIRKMCEKNTCRNYATSWACPPAVGTLEECQVRMQKYDKMLLFSQAYSLKNSFDLKGMMAGLQDFKEMSHRFQKNLTPVLSDFFILSNEGCGRCTKCTYPDAPCRFPQDLQHSLEGYGLLVNELAKEAGIPYHHGPNTVTYFGALLFHGTPESVRPLHRS